MAEVLRIARKEFRGFFASPAAFLFLGAFLGVTLFIFFWVEAFFARNIADVRPLFEWLPLLLIFLVAALTMRAWSEERRSGTLESLLTAPVSPVVLVFGKFTAALGLVALALVLTLPLPITVSFLGQLDWGPVVGGYVATLFLAAAYIAIGLYMSGRTDNAIVALILTVVVCSLFYLIGSNTLTNLFGYEVGDFLALLGSGARFESITRGVLDLRDLYYYLSIVGVFLTLNLFSLERLRWAGNPNRRRHRLWGWFAGLAAANFVAANLWLAPVTWARVDITQGQLYSLSDATKQQLARLREPLLIRGYFSAKTHPLLAPLVPQVKDLLKEYAVAAGGHAQVEFLDPTKDRDAEEEAASRYGIRPVPFQTASKYQAAVVSSYFDVVVAYGDQYQKLGYRDLIEVKSRGENHLNVILKNPEYAITRAIRKVVNAYQAGGNPFETLNHPVTFTGYFSPDARLPARLRGLRGDIEGLLSDLVKESNGKLKVVYSDPDADGGRLAKELKTRYGFRPQVASLVDPKPFWFYMMLDSGGQTAQVPLPATLDKDAVKRSIDAALQRLAPGFLKTVAVFKPASYGRGALRFTRLDRVLSQNVRVMDTNLKDGHVPQDADLLLVLAPQTLNDKQRFAIDQFLMQGGAVVLATSPFEVQLGHTLTARNIDSGLSKWLAHNGIKIDNTMVLDPRNTALPVPVERHIGSISVREIRMLPYPHFPDVRGAGLNPDNPITSSLGQLTMNWASPITVDKKENKGRKVTTLLKSSDQSWVSDSLDIVPNYRAYPGSGFVVAGDRNPRALAVAVEGRFDSYFQGKESPLTTAGQKNSGDKKADAKDRKKKNKKNEPPITSIIEHSPDSAHLVVIASNSFASDTALNFASQGMGTIYTKPVDFLQNAVDWSLEDPGLLALRGRSQFARTLEPLLEGEQRFWEYLNYALAALGLLAVWIWRRLANNAARTRYRKILAEV
jgi:ABC-2 type transport system permease protein